MSAELDHEIATKVMGWKVSVLHGECLRWEAAGPNTDFGDYITWAPSTDMNDAWTVVEKVKPRELRMGWLPSNRYYVNFGFQPVNSCADTAPEAICRASLAAVAQGGAG